jgi:hypothetical protein
MTVRLKKMAEQERRTVGAMVRVLLERQLSGDKESEK